jgi:hypothetical protein
MVWATLAQAPLYGLPTANFVPADFQSQCLTVAQRNVPPGATADFVENCRVMLIARGLMARHKVPGDCDRAGTLDLTNAGLTQEAGFAASSGISAAAKIAGAGSGIASFAGAALPGIGIAVQAITQIFMHHAQAVITEQQVICQVSGVINQVIAYYDAQVKSGALAPSTAYSGMQNFFAQCNGKLATIYKKCNASCQYEGFIAAHSDFVQSYYPYLAPVQYGVHAPGAAPSASGTTPGGVIQVGNAIFSPIEQAVSGFSSTGKLILLGLAAVGIFLVAKAATQ